MAGKGPAEDAAGRAAGPVARQEAVYKAVYRAVLVAAALLVAGALVPAGPVRAGDELANRAWMTLYDGDGNVLCMTGFALEVGDEYIDEDNAMWRVDKVIGNSATASYVRALDLSGAVEKFQLALAASPPAQTGGLQIGIYHTHSDESYQPSDGTDSDPTGRGGVYRVGESLAAGLEKLGVTVKHSLANHLPHDAGAYERSRPTAMEVLRGSSAIFDVHRDAGPPEAYRRAVDGRDISQIMMVLGRANPQADANMGFAQALKAAADRAHPGLVRGILNTGGRFNQDLSSRALLIEFGANTNSRQEAERAATMLSSVIPAVLRGAGGGVPSGGAWRAVGVIFLIVVGGGGVWLYVATGGNWREMWNKLRSLGEEFASYLGRRRPRR